MDGYLKDWKKLLGSHVHQAQRVLRRLVVGRLTMMPEQIGRQTFYRFSWLKRHVSRTRTYREPPGTNSIGVRCSPNTSYEVENPLMKRLMKRALSALVVIGALSACAQAPPAAQNTAADEAKLQADALAWFDLYNKGDADGVANLYADDALLMPPGAPASKGRAAIREFIAADIAKSKAAGITLKNRAVTGLGVSGDAGWLSGTYLVVDASGSTLDTGNYLSVHRRANGAWPYIRDTWNSDKEAATASPVPTP